MSKNKAKKRINSTQFQFEKYFIAVNRSLKLKDANLPQIEKLLSN
jgi:hypothetical protein